MEINGINGYWFSDYYIQRISDMKINMIKPSNRQTPVTHTTETMRIVPPNQPEIKF